MIRVKEAFENYPELNSLLQRDFGVEKSLFTCEVQISLAYCESLFEAGTLNRLETEKVKNGLQTILKRSEFDKAYFNETKSQNIQEFIEQKLFSLVGEVGLKIQLGRSFNERNSTALRLWLRHKIINLSKEILEIQKVLVSFAETNKETIFYDHISNKNSNPVLFAHWCLAKFEMFQRNRERFDEVWRRVNTMPIGANNGIGTSLEFDRNDLAQKLGFERISTNSLDSTEDFDFIIEFINAVAIISVQLSSFIDEIAQLIEVEALTINTHFSPKHLNLLKGKLQRIFAFQAEINTNLQSHLLKQNKHFSGNNEIIISSFKIISNCLKAFRILLKDIKLNEDLIKENLIKFQPNSREIFDYLVQRNQKIENAKDISKKIEVFLLENNSSEKITLENLQKFSSKIENDFFSELSLETILNSKNQIGGTSHERVFEALQDAKKVLHYEE